MSARLPPIPRGEIRLEWTEWPDGSRSLRMPSPDGEVRLYAMPGYYIRDRFGWEVRRGGCVAGSARADIGSIEEAQLAAFEYYRTWARQTAEAAGWQVVPQFSARFAHDIVKRDWQPISVLLSGVEIGMAPPDGRDVNTRGKGIPLVAFCNTDTPAEDPQQNAASGLIMIPDVSDEGLELGYVDLGPVDPADPPTCRHGYGPECAQCKQEATE